MTLDKTTTAQQLIDELQVLDPDTPITRAVPARDHWRNTLACDVTNVEQRSVVWSEYHGEFRYAEDDEEDAQIVYVLE